jgi:hypothetical protein
MRTDQSDVAPYGGGVSHHFCVRLTPDNGPHCDVSAGIKHPQALYSAQPFQRFQRAGGLFEEVLATAHFGVGFAHSVEGPQRSNTAGTERRGRTRCIQLPIARGPEETQEIVWRPARYHAVLSVLKNPIYAGAYAYGRSKTVFGLEGGQKRVRRQVLRRREDWKVLIRDHHEGYIDWEVYQSNQTMIAQNDNARGNAVRGPISCS